MSGADLVPTCPHGNRPIPPSYCKACRAESMTPASALLAIELSAAILRTRGSVPAHLAPNLDQLANTLDRARDTLAKALGARPGETT